MRGMLILALGLLLMSCETLKDPTPGGDASFRPAFPTPTHLSKNNHEVNDGSIYKPVRSLNLFETPIARDVGDVLTVNLVERTVARKRANSRSKKQEDNTTPNPTLFGRPVSLGGLGNGYNLGVTIDADRQFTGEGESNQNNELTGGISVTVARVLANGHLIVQGEKWVHINQGKEFIRLSGIVRQQDISPDNTIPSTKVANARISYSGTGQVNNANAQGWLSKFFWSKIYPY